jgi:hypothetical protein
MYGWPVSRYRRVPRRSVQIGGIGVFGAMAVGPDHEALHARLLMRRKRSKPSLQMVLKVFSRLVKPHSGRAFPGADGP